MFYLGTHLPNWLEQTDVPLFVSHRRLVERKALPRARGPWALDSGGFSELSMFGEWRTSQATYVAAARRYRDDVGRMAWAAIQDWMCEPVMLRKTGLSIPEHQRRTVASYLSLREAAPDLPWVPVLQGWEATDYFRHVDAYEKAGADLRALPLVGVGSVCRRQHTHEVEEVFRWLHRMGLRTHGFGVKVQGARRASKWLTSADSMAWSFLARRAQRPLCIELGLVHGPVKHKNCANCLPFALHARGQIVDGVRSLAA